MDEVLSDDLDDESPSTVKSSFQRWLIVAGVLLTLMFIYLFIAMSNNEREKEALAEDKKLEELPTEIHSGKTDNQNNAIAIFNRGVKGEKVEGLQVGDKIPMSGLDPEYAPRKKAVYLPPSERIVKTEIINKKLTPMEKYHQELELQALKSLNSEDSIGNASAFYSEKKPINQSKSSDLSPEKRSVAERQKEIRSKIEAITKYRKGLQSGKVDPSQAPPLEVLRTLGETK